MKGPKGKGYFTEIQFKAETSGVGLLSPKGFTSLCYRIKCTQCGAERDNIRFDDTEQEIPNSRGTAHFVMTCKDCQRSCNISYKGNSFGNKSADYSEWTTVVKMECRGCSIEEAECHEWTIEDEGGETYDWDANDNFFEYSEELEQPVTVEQLEFRVI